MTRKRMATAALAAAVVLAWILLGSLVPVPSERFYVLVPPVALALFVIWSPGGWRALKPHLRSGISYLVMLTLLLTAYNLVRAARLFPWETDQATMEVLSPREIMVGVYFVVAVTVVLAVPLVLVHRGLLWLFDRLFPAQAGTRSAWVGLVRSGVPCLVMVPIIVPFLIGSLYVHRLKIPNPDPPLGRSFEDVSFVTTDGMTLRGWFFPAKGPPSTRSFIICHGLGANRSMFLPLVAIGDALDANILMFDFRGHGDSDGHTISFGHYEKLDVLAAIDYLRNQRPDPTRELVAIGTSMGSSALILAAAEVKPPLDAVIIDSGFTSAGELVDNVLVVVPPRLRPWLTIPGVPLASLETGCWLPDVRPIDSVPFLRAPVLIVHAQDDMLMPVDHARRLFERAPDPRALWIANTGGHGSTLDDQTQYIHHVRDFLKKNTHLAYNHDW